MRKFVREGFAVTVVAILAALAGCGGNKAVTTVSYPVPAAISLTPSPAASAELGTYVSFTAAAFNSANTTITEPITYQSSNPSVVTVAANGLACAGTWDSLSNPQICTPGSVGVAQISATAQGVTSPVTIVYVHAHIDSVTLQPAQNQPKQQVWPCLSSSPQAVNLDNIYEAHAFSRGIDITSTVGQFSWAALNTTVVKLSNKAPGLANMVNGVSLNQNLISGAVPGITPVYASVGNSNSTPITITTCPVQSIQLVVQSSTSTAVSLTTKTFDSFGNQLPSPPVTWSSSEPGSVAISTAGSATGTTGTGGAATLIATCTPPSCNIGFTPSLPIYPENVVSLTVPIGTSAPTGTVFVSSKGCAGIDGCYTVVAPITYPANTIDSLGTVSSSPNSLLFNRQGTKAYLGTSLGLQSGGSGLVILDPTASPISVSTYPPAPGTVLAVSPDGNTVLVSDTLDTPNQLYVVNVSGSSPSVVAYPITNATAAAFSPDSLKAFILAGSNMYVYSKQDALKTVPLSFTPTGVAFLNEGAFGFLGGGSTPGITGYPTCNPSATPIPITTPATPSFLTPLVGTAQILPGETAPTYHFVGFSSPNIEIISANTTPSGCVSTVTGNSALFNLGQGDFTPTQLIVSEDGTAAYVVSDAMNSILVFGINSFTIGSIGLKGNATPVQAALVPDGTLLYVAASDGTVHVLDTRLSADVQQITFTNNFCLNAAGQPEPFTCKPDLISVRP